MTQEALYKLTGEHGQPLHGGRGAWPLPTRAQDGTWTPGEFREVYGRLEPCANGLHLVRREDLQDWVHPGTVWSVETEGRLSETEGRLSRRARRRNVVVARRARLLRPVGRLTPQMLVQWATECVARADHAGMGVLTHTSDMRARRSVEAARRAARRAADAVTSSREHHYATLSLTYATLAAAAADAVIAIRHAAYARAVVNDSPDAEADAAAAATTERQWQTERLWTLMGASR